MMDKKSKQIDTILKVLRYIKKYSVLMIISIILAGITVALTLYVPILIGRAIDGIVYGNVQFENIMTILIKVVVIVSITAVCQWIMNVINNKVTYNVVADIRKDAFLNIERLPLKFIDSHESGEIVSRVIADADQFADGLLMGFTQFFTGITTIVGTLIFMLSINVSITIGVVILTPISLFVAKFISSKTYSMFKIQSETRGEQTSLINEIIGNEKVVKAYAHEDEAIKKFDEINDRLQKASLRAIFFSSITNPATRFVNGLIYALVAVIGAFVVISGSMTVGALSCFLSYANQYTKPFNEISGVVTELQNAIACADRILQIIDEEPEVQDSRVDIKDVKGNVDIKYVDFSYVQGKDFIKDFNISVKEGQRIAIVGPTGCGKTTLINLLMRFYEINKGQIELDGTDIRKVSRNSLRKSIGMVLQETWLKNATIRENITMGKPDATDEEVIEAAKQANSYSFIKRLPNGFDTVIGEDGGLLSEGQKQLLCITRVMLLKPPMLILDEATSSIDTRTEIKIQQAFDKLMQGRTSFVVAHRLSTIQNADLILVMKDGKIIEKGTHDELLSERGFYYTLFNSQYAV